MPNLSRQDCRLILEYLEATSDMSKRQLYRIMVDRGGLLYGQPTTKQEKKFGRVIETNERNSFFEALAEEMKLTKRQTKTLLWTISDRNLATTLRRAKEHANPKKDKENKGDNGEEPKPPRKGIWRTLFGLP